MFLRWSPLRDLIYHVWFLRFTTVLQGFNNTELLCNNHAVEDVEYVLSYCT